MGYACAHKERTGVEPIEHSEDRKLADADNDQQNREAFHRGEA